MSARPKEGDLKVWWVPQYPCPAFEAPVSSPEEGGKILDVLAKYDWFQLENNIKPDYCNMGGLVVYESDGDDGFAWHEWVDENGYTIEELME